MHARSTPFCKIWASVGRQYMQQQPLETLGKHHHQRYPGGGNRRGNTPRLTAHQPDASVAAAHPRPRQNPKEEMPAHGCTRAATSAAHVTTFAQQAQRRQRRTQRERRFRHLRQSEPRLFPFQEGSFLESIEVEGEPEGSNNGGGADDGRDQDLLVSGRSSDPVRQRRGCRT
jgi:hypothetical protein